MASFDEQDSWAWAAMEPEPTERERALFDLFCQEYLVDRDYVKAASRCGFQAVFCSEYGKLLFQKSYVQRKLAALEHSRADPVREKEWDAINTRARLRAIINDEHQKASSRVSAARELNAMHGLHAPTKIDMTARSGGVMVIPIGDIDTWEQQATASQSKLMEDSRVE